MSDFASFKQSFKGDIVTPTDADYPEAIGRWARNAEANAKIVAFVKTPEDVALAIAYAKENQLPIAIRGGGHSTAGASSTEGLAIDLSRHSSIVEIDPENKLAYVGGGAIWGQVDKAAIQHGLATVAGTVNHTGVGGLTLGGGLGHLCGEHGVVVDNLVKATVVNAHGSILTASETENSDLFWGIRGGGCNFGVVTQFVFKLYPQRRTVFAGPIMFPGVLLERVIQLIDQWWPSIGPKETMMMGLMIPPQGPQIPLVILLLFYNGSEEEGRANFKRFYDLKPIADHAKEIPYEQLNSAPGVEHGQCRLLKGLSHNKPHFPSAKKALDLLASYGNSEMRPMVLVEYYNWDKIRSVPDDACAFQRPKFSNGVVTLGWKNNTPENLTLARNISREFASIIADGQKEYLSSAEPGYGNYEHVPEGGDGEDKAELLFRENYPRLRQLKKQHDPENIFNKWFAITPSQ